MNNVERLLWLVVIATNWIYFYDQFFLQKKRHEKHKKETVAAIIAELKKSDNVLVIKEDKEHIGVVQ